MKKTPIRSSQYVLMIAAGLFGITTGQAAPQIATYDITITNLTSGQPLTPPVVATHRTRVVAFEVGTPASFEVKEIAENGNVVPLRDTFAADKHVWMSTVVFPPPGFPPPILPGGSISFTISATQSAKFLSFVSMLICTNDGFTGLDSLRLPKGVGESVTVSTQAYDAGTEINTEDFADIVPPCQGLVGVMSGDPGTGMSNPTLAEGGVITMHTGIVGGNDLLPFPDIHGWVGPVAEVTITRAD